MNNEKNTIIQIASLLEEASIPYTYIGEAALFIQGVDLSIEHTELLVQWDAFTNCYNLFKDAARSPIEKTPKSAKFQVQVEGKNVTVRCLYNTTIKTDPYRISVKLDEHTVWCKSLYCYLYDDHLSLYKEIIIAHLQQKQQAFTEHNEKAWNQNNYQALIARYGEPKHMAEKIKNNPEWRLYPFLKYMPNLEGKKVLHLLGSNGVKATALALLGAQVTVVDFSKENAMFAQELAKEADVSINYIVSDVFSLHIEKMADQYDYVLMELGVLHYFITLEPLMNLVRALLAKEGLFVLHEFHPISTKLISSTGKKHKIVGNYFDPTLHEQTVAFSKHMPDGVQEELLQTVQRKWTIGELVTSVASSGLCISVLEEEPNHKLHDIGLPKTFTLISKK
ncbi:MULTISPECIES: class I SAM-dependent methyltransferase [Bacillus]|uniref:class I SAM-dependent methyltransferase n=1 Tax=Bacillus TaxID=1386 RepID=UPI0002D45695|nr:MULTISPECIES: methyltransferase domain-containing protein [Bacillus]